MLLRWIIIDMALSDTILFLINRGSQGYISFESLLHIVLLKIIRRCLMIAMLCASGPIHN